MKKMRPIIFCLFIALYGFSWPFSNKTSSEAFGSSMWINQEVNIFHAEANNINPNVLKLGLEAYVNGKKQGYSMKDMLTIIDYSKPSTQRRLWVFDVKSGKTLFNTWVSHGKNSGTVSANSFSNAPGSLKSSYGVFITDMSPYIGGNGYSLRMKGLEKGINDNAYRRDIVFHGAWYVSPDTIKKYGQLGRSWGCPAVDTHLAKALIDTIKAKSLVFAYYPDRNWLRGSKFLAMN